MAKARLFVREVGKTAYEQNNGDYASEEAALTEGTRLCTHGGVEAFEVWSLAAAYEREFVVRRTDEVPADVD
jgi:hypothetical protein